MRDDFTLESIEHVRNLSDNGHKYKQKYYITLVTLSQTTRMVLVTCRVRVRVRLLVTCRVRVRVKATGDMHAYTLCKLVPASVLIVLGMRQHWGKRRQHNVYTIQE